MKRILLVDANSYNISIPEDAHILRAKYYRVKQFVKRKKIKGLDRNNKIHGRTYAIGLLRIATILNFNGYSVKYMSLDEVVQNELSSLLCNIDIVAFSAVTPTVPKCAELCCKIKELFSDIIVVIGGAHINVAKQHTISRYPCFDIYADGYDLDGASKIISIPAESLCRPDVYVDYSLLPHPLSEYSLNTFSTLGCIYSCDYCQDHLIPYFENPDITGLSQFVDVVPKGSIIHFFDSVLGVKHNRAKDVCTALMKMNHGFLLSCDARAEIITPEYVKMLEAAGFVEVSLGMETADDTVLRANNRFLAHSRLLNAFEIIRKHSDLYVSVYNAIGIPGSTIRSTTMSRNCLEQLLLDDYIDDIKSGIYVPYPIDGKDYAARGLTIECDDWARYDRQSFPVYRLKDMTAQDIWNESINLLQVSVDAWLTKYGIGSIDSLPDEYWMEYLCERNNIVEG